MRLLLIRHGETKLNSTQRYWGRTDVELSVDGFRQAEKLRDRLSGERIDAIYSSDLKRALETAKLIASRHHTDIIACAELREIDFGKIEGLNYEEICQLYPEVAKSWIERDPKPKYPGGESRDDFDNRVTKFFDRLKNHKEQETIVIVAHSGVLRTLMCQLLGVEGWFRWRMHVELASISILETYPKGAIIMLLNDVCHLR